MSLCLFLLSVMTTVTPYGGSISADDWAIKEQPELGLQNAVILDHRTYFGKNRITIYRKVRILSNAGRQAAQFKVIGEIALVRGRVIYPTGQERLIDSKDDLVSEFYYGDRDGDKRLNTLLMPGLTNNCIAEFEITIDIPKKKEGISYDFAVQEAFYIKQKSFHKEPDIDFGTEKPLRFIWSKLNDPKRMEKGKKGEFVRYREIAPIPSYPMGNIYYDPGALFYSVFPTEHIAADDPSHFWGQYMQDHILRNYSLKVRDFKEYKQWLKSLKKSLPKDRLKAAEYILQRLRTKVKTGLFTPAQSEAYAQMELNWEWDNALIDRFQKGYSDAYGFNALYMRLLEECEIPYTLILAKPAMEKRFEFKEMRPFSFNLNSLIFLFQNAQNKGLYVLPSKPQYRVGTLPAEYEGTTGLSYSSATKRVRLTRLPMTSAPANSKVFQYKTKILPSGKIEMNRERRFSGHYEAYWRNKFYPLYQEEREDFIRRDWQQDGYAVSSVRFDGLTSLEAPLVEHVSVTGQVDLSKKKLGIAPFPNIYSPVGRVSYWPENRQQPIIMDNTFYQKLRNTIELPEGWRLAADVSWQRKNVVGAIAISVKQEGNVVTVSKDVAMLGSRFSAESEQEMKTFLAWMEELYEYHIAIVKGDAS